MGQRANLIVIEDGNRQMFYTHWRANTLPTDLFWGPDHATKFVRVQRPVAFDETGWLDDVWSEGGAVIDHDARVFLLYGGEDIAYEVAYRRAYLEAVRRVWEGWEVRWAYEGIAEMADYVGYPREAVLTRDDRAPDKPRGLKPPTHADGTRAVASVARGRGVHTFYPLMDEDVIYEGPSLLESAARFPGEATLDVADVPAGGFHLDVERKKIDFWCARDLPEGADGVARYWPGWVVTWHRDRYESQLELAGDALVFGEPDPQALRRRLKDLLLFEEKRNGVDALLSSIERLEECGSEVTEINPLATRDASVSLSREERLRIVERALGVGPSDDK